MKKIKIFPKMFIQIFSVLAIIIILVHSLVFFIFPKTYLETRKEKIHNVANEISEKKITFSESAQKELSVLEAAVREIVDLTVDAFCEDDLEMAAKIEPLRELIGILCNDLKNRHVTRLREGKCEFRQGFAFNDLLTNLERIAAHCSNVAVAMIETETSEFDTHEYLKSVRHMKDDAYLECFDSYARKYSIPPTKKEKKNK